MATEKQIAANRLNGLKGGVKTPEGKAISRMNARKHGIFASALTEADAEEIRSVLQELVADLKPVGIVEELLVDKLAVTYLRMRRCAQGKALHFKRRWNSSFGQPGEFGYDETVVTIGQYDARLTHQFLRLLHEIEWRKKARRSTECAPQSLPALSPPHIGRINVAGAECRTQNEELDSSRKGGTGVDESDPTAKEPEMQNELNSPRELPASVVTSRLDSRLRGNDESDPTAVEPEMKNEPISRGPVENGKGND